MRPPITMLRAPAAPCRWAPIMRRKRARRPISAGCLQALDDQNTASDPAGHGCVVSAHQRIAVGRSSSAPHQDGSWLSSTSTALRPAGLLRLLELGHHLSEPPRGLRRTAAQASCLGSARVTRPSAGGAEPASGPQKIPCRALGRRLRGRWPPEAPLHTRPASPTQTLSSCSGGVEPVREVPCACRRSRT